DQVCATQQAASMKSFRRTQIAQPVGSAGHESVLESHRREVSVVFCALRGFTAFSELAEPEEVILVLREYQTKLGVLINKFEGTVERFSGDGLLVVFNDPLPCPDASMRAGWRSKCAMRLRSSQSSGAIPGTISVLALELRTVMQRLEASDTRGGYNIQLRARWRISPPDFAIRLRMDKFWSILMCSALSRHWRM